MTYTDLYHHLAASATTWTMEAMTQLPEWATSSTNIQWGVMAAEWIVPEVLEGLDRSGIDDQVTGGLMADAVRSLVEPFDPEVEEKSTEIAGPEVDKQIEAIKELQASHEKEGQDLLEKQAEERKAAEKQLDDIRSQFEKTHENDSAEQQAQDQAKFDAAENMARQELEERQQAELERELARQQEELIRQQQRQQEIALEQQQAFEHEL